MKGKWLYCDLCNFALDISKLKLWQRIPKCENCGHNIWNTNPNQNIPVPNYSKLIGL